MESSLNKDRPAVRLRAFRAIDDPDTCEKFIEGHTQVLSNIGITKVTSSKHDWMYNPAAFVMVVESMDGERVYGGARVHVAGGNQPLPIEEATCALDPKIFGLIWQYAQHGTGELCGLWNSREIAGHGIGSIFLIRTAAAISHQIGIQSLFALCAPYTIKPGEAVGMELEPNVGNQGTFYYPKLDLIATTMVLKDVPTLSKAHSEDKEAILKIRENLDILRMEVLRNKEIEIDYKIRIPNLENWDLAKTISNAKINYQESIAKL
ncbi:hypothetical protein Pedsa_3351 [Pseudopedobacter saltans DSM 12145]|uniref:N-acetyltransferase domain-containing protein n=1 Tax=Pseudopedobacter saltans (strain ATCC 51119 / DSM 12145 / JCM 21818 / CCUG 39354 / LMG 10337 / NBRC 100064 / NCIMB 13643) TaxID=762903 RepID=F0SCP2_PSESL|nr:hypothetical protein [Pseudopedobacter saltans]ADY53886.1 hypothetical protein Pedsa_3351 [Pseudopedobacter saltans DSM 12145]